MAELSPDPTCGQGSWGHADLEDIAGWKGWLIKQAVELLLSIYQEALVCLHSRCQAAGALTHVHFLGFWEGKRMIALFWYSFFYVGSGEWAQEMGNWSQGVNLWLCLSVPGVTQPWGWLSTAQEGTNPHLWGASALPQDTAGAEFFLETLWVCF